MASRSRKRLFELHAINYLLPHLIAKPMLSIGCGLMLNMWEFPDQIFTTPPWLPCDQLQ